MKGMRKVALTVAVLAAACAVVLGVGFAVEPESGVRAIEPSSPCPATACASGACHGFADVPQPDGVHEMTCPEAGCASVECHAWESLVGRYHQASDASLNLWLLMPAALMAAVYALAAASRKGVRREKK
ncbi:MAG: hypothetical protein Q4C41_08850 [Eggerthellaceae bacterium]|nr:hypothetical protein [Eggerthellaceae bacterium]